MATTALTHARAAATLAPRLTVGEEVVKFVRTKPLGAAGAAIMLGMVLVGIFAGVLAPYDPYWGDYALQFARPSADHCLRPEEVCRGVVSRVMDGGVCALI